MTVVASGFGGGAGVLLVAEVSNELIPTCQIPLNGSESPETSIIKQLAGSPGAHFNRYGTLG